MARTKKGIVVPAADPAPAPIGHNKPPKEEKIFGMDASKVDTKFLAQQAQKLSTIGQKLANNAQLAAVAGKTRSSWYDYGSILKAVRSVITSNVGFNEWLKANNLEQYADRNTRTDAMWLAEKIDPEFLEAHAPADTHSPKRIRTWYRNSIRDLLELTEGRTDEEAIGALDVNPTLKALYDSLPAEDWDAHLAGWKAKQARKAPAWPDTDTQDAAKFLLVKIAKHGNPGDVGRLVADAINGIMSDPQNSWATWLASQTDPEPGESGEPQEPAPAMPEPMFTDDEEVEDEEVEDEETAYDPEDDFDTDEEGDEEGDEDK